MAINSIEYAKKYASELDKLVVQKSVTGFLADNVLGAQFVGGKTVLLPSMEFVGLGDYDRDNGFPTGKITITNTAYQLAQDRGRELQLDRMDMDETGVANLAGQMLNEFVRTSVVPELDAYCISTLAKIAKERGNVTEFDGDVVYEQFCDMANRIQAECGFDEELVCFVSPEAYASLMNSPELQRQIVVSDFKQGEINLQVKKINDVAIIPVSFERMFSSYSFNAGTDALSGGFTLGEDATLLHLVMLPKSAASLIKKTEDMRVFAPDSNQNADAYLFQYRIYYDCLVRESCKNFIKIAE